MELRGKKAGRFARLIFIGAAAAPWVSAQVELQVRHKRLLGDHTGVLTLEDAGLSYQRTPSGKKGAAPEKVHWDYQDIQQLWLSPEKIVILTYHDRKWLLGMDKEFEFRALPGESFEKAYPVLKRRLDQRFVAALADSRTHVLWELPVKLLGTLTGSEGMLQVGADQIVYKTPRAGQSRTWRYLDIENVSTSGPFQLTLTTYERARTHYGALKGFNFQLKQRLDEGRYDLLWRRVNRDKGLRFLTAASGPDSP